MSLVEPVASRGNREWGQYLILGLCPVCLVTFTGSLSIPELPTTCHKAGSMPQGASVCSCRHTVAYCTIYHVPVCNCGQRGTNMWLKRGSVSEGHIMGPSLPSFSRELQDSHRHLAEEQPSTNFIRLPTLAGSALCAMCEPPMDPVCDYCRMRQTSSFQQPGLCLSN